LFNCCFRKKSGNGCVINFGMHCYGAGLTINCLVIYSKQLTPASCALFVLCRPKHRV
jgi:hypothetical protein